MDNPTRIGYSTLVVVFIIAFLLGYGTSSRIVNRSAGYGTEPAETSEARILNLESALTQIEAESGQGPSTVAADDQPSGSSVNVAVKTDIEVWVAVHEDVAGKPSKILGAQLFSADTNLGKVELLRPTAEGMKYHAILHSDDGDRKFDPAKDSPLTNGAGAVTSDEFTATAGAGGQ